MNTSVRPAFRMSDVLRESNISEEPMSTASTEYSARVDAVLRVAADFISASGLQEARNLANHAEGPEALSTLAWLIIHEEVTVPRDLVNEIRSLSEGYTYPEDFPRGLDDWASERSL